jgi:uncharacterized protein YifN (PemK superfamily)
LYIQQYQHWAHCHLKPSVASEIRNRIPSVYDPKQVEFWPHLFESRFQYVVKRRIIVSDKYELLAGGVHVS